MNFLKFISRKGKKLVDLPQDARVFGYVGKANVENYMLVPNFRQLNNSFYS